MDSILCKNINKIMSRVDIYNFLDAHGLEHDQAIPLYRSVLGGEIEADLLTLAYDKLMLLIQRLEPDWVFDSMLQEATFLFDEAMAVDNLYAAKANVINACVPKLYTGIYNSGMHSYLPFILSTVYIYLPQTLEGKYGVDGIYLNDDGYFMETHILTRQDILNRNGTTLYNMEWHNQLTSNSFSFADGWNDEIPANQIYFGNTDFTPLFGDMSSGLYVYGVEDTLELLKQGKSKEVAEDPYRLDPLIAYLEVHFGVVEGIDKYLAGVINERKTYLANLGWPPRLPEGSFDIS